MIKTCPKAWSYLSGLNMDTADEMDKIAWELLHDTRKWELVTKSINDRFIKGVSAIAGIDRGGRLTRIRREFKEGQRIYFIEGIDGSWSAPDEKVWVWAMVELERRKRGRT